MTFEGGRGGEVWVISERKISRRLISRGKNSCKEISGGKKCYPEKRYLSWRIMLEKIFTPLYVKKKNSITRGLGKVKSLPKPNPPYRPPPPLPPSSSKVIWSTPYSYSFENCKSVIIVILFGRRFLTPELQVRVELTTLWALVRTL